MNKTCTSLEQSKKLIELGIDINTADLYWSRCTITDFGDGVLKVSYAVEPCNISQFRYTKEDIPAWSLAALLGILSNSNYKLSSEHNKHTCSVELFYGEETVVWFDNPVDACCEIILKLYELNLL